MIGGGDPSISAQKITKQQMQLIDTHQCKKVTQKIYLANLLNEIIRKFIVLIYLTNLLINDERVSTTIYVNRLYLLHRANLLCG